MFRFLHSIHAAAGNEPTPQPIGKNTIGIRPVPPPKPVNNHPPYRMPPQPAQMGSYGEATIPGTATTTEQQTNSAVSLRTHSSKFPVSRNQWSFLAHSDVIFRSQNQRVATRKYCTSWTEWPRMKKMNWDKVILRFNAESFFFFLTIYNLQIERELILSSDKASSKIPLMHEVRNTPSGPRRTAAALLPRQTGAIAPDHPPKQLQAWVRLLFLVYRVL